MRTKSGRIPDRIEVRYSRIMVVIGWGLFLWAVGWCLSWIPAIFSGTLVGVALGLTAPLAVPFLLVMFLPDLLHTLKHRGPVLVMDLEGVTDRRKKGAHLSWDDVADVDLGSGTTTSKLCFALRRADRRRQDLPWLGALGVLMHRMMGMSDWNVGLFLLSCNKGDLLEAARTLRERRIRRQAVQANRARETSGDPFQGWSGRL